MGGTIRREEQSVLYLVKQIANFFSHCKASQLYSWAVITFRTICTKSLEFCGESPWSWQVQASREDACATIRMLFPEIKWEMQVEEGDEASFRDWCPRSSRPFQMFKMGSVYHVTTHWTMYINGRKYGLLTPLEHFSIFRIMVNSVLLSFKMAFWRKQEFQWDVSSLVKQMLFAYPKIDSD